MKDILAKLADLENVKSLTEGFDRGLTADDKGYDDDVDEFGPLDAPVSPIYDSTDPDHDGDDELIRGKDEDTAYDDYRQGRLDDGTWADDHGWHSEDYFDDKDPFGENNLGEDGIPITEKSTSQKQARFMAAAAHDPKFAKKAGIKQSVAKEFNKADTGTKQLSNAMKHKNESAEVAEGVTVLEKKDQALVFPGMKNENTNEDFASVEKAVAKNPKVKNPAAVAASIGRKKLGQKEMTRRSVAGRKHADESIVTEKWDTEYKTPASKKGMFTGKNMAELKSQLSKLKASGPHKKGSPGYTKEKELNFAIRAKSGWKKTNESIDRFSSIKSPKLVEVLRHFGKEIKDFELTGELDDNLFDALYNYWFDDMPYGVKKARTGDPYEWISNRLGYELGIHSDGVEEDMSPAITDEGAAGDIMPLEDINDNSADEQMACPYCGKDVPDGVEPAHFKCCGEIGHAQPRSEVDSSFGEDSLDLEPPPGEEVITELRDEDEQRIHSTLTDLGLDQGLDYWVEGDEIVAIGGSVARIIINAIGGHIQGRDGEEYQIGPTSRQQATDRSPEVNDLESLVTEPEVEESIEMPIQEEIDPADVEILTMRYKSGLISYEEFRSELNALEDKDFATDDLAGSDNDTFNRSEIGQNWDAEPIDESVMSGPDIVLQEIVSGERDIQEVMVDPQDSDEEAAAEFLQNMYDNIASDYNLRADDDFEEIKSRILDQLEKDYQEGGAAVAASIGRKKLGQKEMTRRSVAGLPVNDVDEAVDEWDNSPDPEVHTNTTDMINQGDDLNRPKKQNFQYRGLGNNPMAEAKSLVNQYNAMRNIVKVKN